MLVTIDTASIPPENFDISARKNATNRADRRCPVPDPAWLHTLLKNGCQLQLENIIVQAGQHFADAVNRTIFGSDTTKRQAATAIAWTVIAMLRPYVENNQLFVLDPVDSDIKRLCSEILGVGMTLELLRANGVVEGRTIQKIAGSFDYEAFGPNGVGLIQIEAKGTFNDVKTSDHRGSIARKIKNSGLPRGYDSAIGIIASLWTAGNVRTFDVEICDPERHPDDRSPDAIREVIRFYARRFDEAVAIPEGTETLFAIAADGHLFDPNPPAILGRLTRDPRKPFGAFYHNRLLLRRSDLRQEFWGNFWEPWKLPVPLSLVANPDLRRSAFMGIDAEVFRLIRERDFRGLLSYHTNDKGLWRAEGQTYAAVFNVDRYGIVRGLIDGDLPMEVNADESQ